MMPSLVAQLVVLLKDTSLGYIVAYGELLRAVQVMADFLGPHFLFPIFFVAAAIYIAINICRFPARDLDRDAAVPRRPPAAWRKCRPPAIAAK